MPSRQSRPDVRTCVVCHKVKHVSLGRLHQNLWTGEDDFVCSLHPGGKPDRRRGRGRRAS
ncbi:MAG: hypothetical protein ACYS9X_18155 [Planctomycetota bacterium]|jgi:hypothetical protein